MRIVKSEQAAPVFEPKPGDRVRGRNTNHEYRVIAASPFVRKGEGNQPGAVWLVTDTHELTWDWVSLLKPTTPTPLELAPGMACETRNGKRVVIQQNDHGCIARLPDGCIFVFDLAKGRTFYCEDYDLTPLPDAAFLDHYTEDEA